MILSHLEDDNENWSDRISKMGHMPIGPNMIKFKRGWAVNYYYRALGVYTDYTTVDPHFLNTEHFNT